MTFNDIAYFQYFFLLSLCKVSKTKGTCLYHRMLTRYKKILSVSSSSVILLYAISISHSKSGKINQTCAISFPLASSLHINLFNRTRFSRILYYRLFVSEIAFLKNGQTQIPKLILFRYLRLSSFIMLLHFYQRLPILTFCI